MVAEGILYYPCVIPDHKEDCTVNTCLTIYLKNPPQKEEVIANIKVWVNGIMQLKAFKEDQVHLEQVNIYPVP